MAERTPRSIKTCITNITSSAPDSSPSQEMITHAALAKNHVPHTITGLPPSLAMAGRCGVLEGHSTTAFNHGPDCLNPAIKQENTMGNIKKSRNAIITADADHSVRAFINRQVPSRIVIRFPVGITAHIDARNKWSGAFRVVARSRSNLIAAPGGGDY